MEIHNVRQQLRTKSIYDIPLRVTYYARVSSESDEQINSLGNQINFYEDLIKKNKAWTFVPGYIDEGLSGISTKHRENFNRMISDAEQDKFDLIITKEISRFARNTLDSIQFTRQLLNSGVGVFFQNDNINTFDDDSELRLSIMSSIAQDELRKLSSRVKFGHQQAIKQNVVLGNSRIFGYKKENKRLVIDESQAPMIRELFEIYATDNYSMKQIEEIFWEKGYRNYNGNKIAHTTMSGIISNPKYKGYYVGNKVKIVDMFTKKQKFLPPEEWVMFKDETGEIVPAIVTESIWDKANDVLRKRSDDVKNRQNICNHANLLTGKLFCTCCGTSYHRRASVDRHGNKNSTWTCANKLNNGKDCCSSFIIHEREIIPILFDVFRDTQNISHTMIDEYEQMYKSIVDDTNTEKQIEKLESAIELSNKKKNKLLELVTTDSISINDFKKMTEVCNKEIKDAEQKINSLNEQKKSNEEFQKNMKHIRDVLSNAEKDCANGKITKEFVDTFVDKILVTPVDSHTMKLDIKIFTGETCEKYINNLKKQKQVAFSSGHTFKKMCPELNGKYTRENRSSYEREVEVKYIANIIL